MINNMSIRTLQKLSFYVDDVVFPCSKDDLLRYAEHNYAPEDLLNAIEELPACSCNNIDEVITKIVTAKQTQTTQYA